MREPSAEWADTCADNDPFAPPDPHAHDLRGQHADDEQIDGADTIQPSEEYL